MRRKHTSSGFTLIELLVVIAIIGLLSSIVLAAVSKARDAASVAVTYESLHQVQTAFQEYYLDTGTYPGGSGCYYATGFNNWCCVSVGGNSCNWSSGSAAINPITINNLSQPSTQLAAVSLSTYIKGLPTVFTTPITYTVNSTNYIFQGLMYQCVSLDSNNNCNDVTFAYLIKGGSSKCPGGSYLFYNETYAMCATGVNTPVGVNPLMLEF